MEKRNAVSGGQNVCVFCVTGGKTEVLVVKSSNTRNESPILIRSGSPIVLEVETWKWAAMVEEPKALIHWNTEQNAFGRQKEFLFEERRECCCKSK